MVGGSEDGLQIAGVITKIQKIITRKNQTMLFVKIEDDTGNVEVLIFPSLLKETQNLWEEGKVVYIYGNLSQKDQENKILANSAIELRLGSMHNTVNRIKQANDYGQTSSGRQNISDNGIYDLLIVFPGGGNGVSLERLKEKLGKYPGSNKVYFEIKQSGRSTRLETDYRVSTSKMLVTELRTAFSDLLEFKLLNKRPRAR
jgi:DNA polymerase-3 subunit alpha